MSVSLLVVCVMIFLIVFVWAFVCFFFFKQKTAYEMRISDWSSDVCSSDLLDRVRHADLRRDLAGSGAVGDQAGQRGTGAQAQRAAAVQARQIGRASCRERVCQYV